MGGCTFGYSRGADVGQQEVCAADTNCDETGARMNGPAQSRAQ
eukprot:gene1951-5039_t